MSLPLNQGTVSYGTQVLTINSNAFVAESVTVDQGSFEILRMNSTGVVDGRVLGPEPIKGSATLLYSAIVTNPPVPGETFTVSAAGNTLNAVVVSVGESSGQREMQKCSITWVASLDFA